MLWFESSARLQSTMKAEEIQNLITFHEFTMSDNVKAMEGRLTIRATAYIHKEELPQVNRAELHDHLKMRLREEIMRKLYDDQVSETANAIMELMVCPPFEHEKAFAARDRLISLMKRQSPK